MPKREAVKWAASSNRPILWLIVVVALAQCSVHVSTPNVLLIVSEDNGPELGAYGHPHARTPMLDSLARDGTLFRNAYVPQAGCSQSRAAFLTGLFPHQNGQIGLATWKFGLYRDDTPNLVERLKSAGYRTGIIGKLHINPESAFPFDFWEIPTSNFQRKDLQAYVEAAGRFFSASEAPFFLSVNYPDAHRPFLREVGGLPDNPLEPSGVEPLAYMGLDSPTLRRDTADYLNSIARLDSLVGDLLRALEQSGKADETLVVYLGDHGADLLRGKRTIYEGGLKVPLLVRWPGEFPAGQEREELVSALDLVPTILTATGAMSIPGLPGRSLLPLLRGESPQWREYLFAEYHLHSNHNYFPQRSVRGKRYKLIQNLLPDQRNPGYAFTIERFVGRDEMTQALGQADAEVRQAYELMASPPELELYDLHDDPYEFHNLADDPEYVPVVAGLRQALDKWRRDTADPFLGNENVLRLKAEIDATLIDGQYQRPSGWSYANYLTATAD